ncbi:MAG: alpha-amylase [Deltaproteobacteria bacterium]|nr:alpha-amylase [Deltaproteobacteria bacterium]
MPSVCFYFQVHQPLRLKHYPYFHVGNDHTYFDRTGNQSIFLKVAHKSYLPTNKLLLELIRTHRNAFKVAFSITGVAIEQMRRFCPEVLDSFKELAQTGCVEFLAETYYHSLSSIYDETEFSEQIDKHIGMINLLFHQTPKIFRNTELINSDAISAMVERKGFQAMLAEGADDILEWRSPCFVYQRNGGTLKYLLKSYKLSDDIAFRFSNQSWSEFPLTAPKFANWVHNVSGNGQVVNLFMDYETFGEHQWSSTGIFEFLKALPAEILQHKDWNFLTPSEVIQTYPPVASLSFPRIVSWADLERDLTAWQGNHMQKAALRQVYEFAQEMRNRNNPVALDLWRKLQISDHFYYMCTKWFSDGDVHAYFNPYQNPYEAFINYMNVLTDFRKNVLHLEAI